MGPSQDSSSIRLWLENFWKAQTRISPDESSLGLDQTQSQDSAKTRDFFKKPKYLKNLKQGNTRFDWLTLARIHCSGGIGVKTRAGSDSTFQYSDLLQLDFFLLDTSLTEYTFDDYHLK